MFDDAVFEHVLLKQAERVMMGSLERQQPETPFFHYTTRQGFLGILDTAAIWGTEYRKLNDTSDETRGAGSVHEAVVAQRGAAAWRSRLGGKCNCRESR